MKKRLNTLYSLLNTTSKSNGLTMIELLVVIAILAILMIVLLLSLRGQTYKARDARRKADIDAYEKAFEDYFNDNDHYPPEGAIDNCNTTDLSPYMKTVRCDPMGDNVPYYYWVNDATEPTAYAICANLENDTDPAIEENGCQAGCDPDGESDYCMVVNEDISVVGGDYNAWEGVGDGPGVGEYACVSGGNCDRVGPGNSCEYTWTVGGCEGLCPSHPEYICN